MKKNMYIIIGIIIVVICLGVFMRIANYDKLSSSAIKREFYVNKETFIFIRNALADKGEITCTKDNYNELLPNATVAELYNNYPEMRIYSSETYTYFELGFNKNAKYMGVAYISNVYILENQAHRMSQEYEPIHYIDHFDKLIDNWYMTSTISRT